MKTYLALFLPCLVVFTSCSHFYQMQGNPFPENDSSVFQLPDSISEKEIYYTQPFGLAGRDTTTQIASAGQASNSCTQDNVKLLNSTLIQSVSMNASDTHVSGSIRISQTQLSGQMDQYTIDNTSSTNTVAIPDSSQKKINPDNLSKPKKENKIEPLAVISLVFALIMLWPLLDAEVLLALFFAALAFVFGILAIRRIKKKYPERKGLWMAWVGALMGGGVIAALIIGILVFLGLYAFAD